MKCVFCGTWTEVRETRGTRRRRECANGHRFFTNEVVELKISHRDRQIADAVVLGGMTQRAAAAQFGVQSDSYASRCVKRYYPAFNARVAGQRQRRDQSKSTP